jgi:hypothetical protein
MAKKTGTMAKVGTTIKEAAATVAHAAEEYVVQPVGKAVGLIKPSAKKTAAGRTLTGKVAKAMPKVGAKRAAKKGPGPKAYNRHPVPVSASRSPRTKAPKKK